MQFLSSLNSTLILLTQVDELVSVTRRNELEAAIRACTDFGTAGIIV